ncbi:uncharacterized protein LOC125653711 isoform X2 [Ostrea edulis]|uniref:uncharacterized protein LOC125653711 isoform X2 n=1 Tax=Ostrea edulis TaxID=37623 RepID=UPI0024AF75D7|nr:uncharacterized protein LOC125653711 isoform X2 [Ostrea edulis]
MASPTHILQILCFLSVCLLLRLSEAGYYCYFSYYRRRYYCTYYSRYYYYYYSYYDSSAGAIAGAVIGGIIGLLLIITCITCLIVQLCKKKSHGQVIIHPSGQSSNVSYVNTYQNNGLYTSGPYVTVSGCQYGVVPSAPPPPPYAPNPPPYSPPPAFHFSQPEGVS